MPDTAAFKARLESELEELESRQSRIADDLAEPLNADSSEQAIEMEDDASLEGQGALIAKEIASVKRALARIEASGWRLVQFGWHGGKSKPSRTANAADGPTELSAAFVFSACGAMSCGGRDAMRGPCRVRG